MRFVLRRALEMVVVLLGVTFAIYAVVFALPGDPIVAMAGSDRQLPQPVIDNLRAKYHLDQPFLVQYWEYLKGLLVGDLGTDFQGRAVADRMAARWPTTIVLGLTAWGLEVLGGVLLGIWAAVRRGRAADRIILSATILVGSIPVFVLAVSAQMLLGVKLHWFPVAGIREGWPMSFLLPAAILAIYAYAAVTRLTRDSVITALDSDYVRTLWAKGLSGRRVLWIHVMRNAAIPVLTYLAMDLGFLLGGAIIVEGIFNMPGVGQLLFQGVRNHEGPVVVGVTSYLILLFLVMSALVDVLNSLLDPRIRRE